MTSREHPSEAESVRPPQRWRDRNGVVWRLGDDPDLAWRDSVRACDSPTRTRHWVAENLGPLDAIAEGVRETFTEWGVRWTDGDVTTTQGRASESDAEDFVEFLADCGLAGGSLVSRTVTRSEWTPASEGGAPDA